jgi:osmotically-inducible protein OsmY
MSPNAMTGRLLILATAGALALTLTACDLKPAADNPAKTFESPVENAVRNAGPMGPAEGTESSASASMASDAALAARVEAALSNDPALRSIKVNVDAANGVITLSGTADTPGKSDQAATVALQVDGVRSVKNEMVVVRGS